MIPKITKREIFHYPSQVGYLYLQPTSFMPAPTKAFRVEIYHQVEGLIAVFPFATLQECEQAIKTTA